jgi:hypothetical protein
MRNLESAGSSPAGQQVAWARRSGAPIPELGLADSCKIPVKSGNG